MRVAFIVGEFPVVSEPFIINQVADLLDRGIQVDVYTFRRGDEAKASARFKDYDMLSRMEVLDPPRSIVIRVLGALHRLLLMLIRSPETFLRMVSVSCSRHAVREMVSLKYIFWLHPFIGRKYDVVHCHFGSIATKYVRIREMLGDNVPMITTLYGYDISHIVQQKGKEVYSPLHEACALYLVMSNNMKDRAVANGFPAERIVVHPVSLPVNEYIRAPRLRTIGEPVRLVTVARLVEKKGIDDLLRAVSIVKTPSQVPFTSTIIGGGPLAEELRVLAKNLGVDDVVEFTGPIPFDEVNRRLREADIYVQPSKTAKDGDME